jgi:hypothetical protein
MMPAPVTPKHESHDQPLQPSLEAAGLSALKAALASSTVYLEYGCGGSTLLASQNGRLKIVSIDSDSNWIARVQSRLASEPERSALTHILAAPVGQVAAWGRPIDRRKIAGWPKYSTLPWIYCRSEGLVADLVFIDGRFRVACFCATYLSAREGTTVLFDDFKDRRHYDAVLALLKPQRLHGRMAEFLIPSNRDFATAAWLLAEHAIQPA